MADFTNTSGSRSSKGWIFAVLAVVAILVLLLFAGGGETISPGGDGDAVAPAPAVDPAPVVTD